MGKGLHPVYELKNLNSQPAIEIANRLKIADTNVFYV
jgi:hypothetical protein